MKITKIGFIGLGLIGASIAKKIKHDNPEIKIIATAKHEKTIIDAFDIELIDNNTLLPMKAFSECDCIFASNICSVCEYCLVVNSCNFTLV